MNLEHLNAADNPELWRTMVDWLLDLDQTHSAFPALCFFPESLPDQSWVASLGAVIDGASVLLSSAHFGNGDAVAGDMRGPLQIVIYGIPAVVRIGRAAGLPIQPAAPLAELLPRLSDPPPAISVSRHEYFAVLDRLEGFLVVPEAEREASWRRFGWIRSTYDEAIRGLAAITEATPAPWATDRPALVGRPRLLLHRPLTVNWSMATAGRPDPSEPREVA